MKRESASGREMDVWTFKIMVGSSRWSKLWMLGVLIIKLFSLCFKFTFLYSVLCRWGGQWVSPLSADFLLGFDKVVLGEDRRQEKQRRKSALPILIRAPPATNLHHDSTMWFETQLFSEPPCHRGLSHKQGAPSSQKTKYQFRGISFVPRLQQPHPLPFLPQPYGW